MTSLTISGASRDALGVRPPLKGANGLTLTPPPIGNGYHVEPLPIGQAWVRGDHSWRQKVSLRPCDMRWTLELMRGTGTTPATYLRYLVQRGIAAVMAECEGS